MKWQRIVFSQLYLEPSRNGIYKSQENHGTGIKIINMGELFGYDFIADQPMKRISMTDSEIDRFCLQNGDLLFGRRSLVESGAGKCSLIDNMIEKTTFESSIIRVRLDPNLALPKFYYYWFKSLRGSGAIRAIVTGTNVKGIKGSDLKNIIVDYPSIITQQKISDILSKYDDLIENNRRRIELLERSARLLYKEWFVRLRFPGHEHTPIIDGIPEGWEKVKLQSIIKIFHGFAFRSEQFVEQKTNTIVVRMGNFKEEGGLKFEEKDNKYLIENSYNEKYLLKPRDLLMVLSDVTRDGRIIGNVGFVPNDNNLYVLNQRVARIEAPEDLKLYLYCSFGSSLYKNHCLSRANSVTVLNLKNDHIYEYQILIPDHQRLLIFSGIVKSIVNNIHVLEQQNQKLKQARDILLPKLMNGEIEV